jgi:hypothetical protein
MANESYYGEQGVSLLPAKPTLLKDTSGSEGFSTGAANAISWGKIGSAIPGVGTGIGMAAGVISGFFKSASAKRKIRKENEKRTNNYSNNKAAYDDGLSGSLDMYAANQEPDYFQNQYAKEGGKLDGTKDPYILTTLHFVDSELSRRKKETILRSGGSVNIIPKGVTHEEKNKLGDNGIPIVSGKEKKKIAEIELNELVLHKEISERIEQLTEDHKKDPENEDILLELGRLMQSEILNNTLDLQGELLDN